MCVLQECECYTLYSYTTARTHNPIRLRGYSCKVNTDSTYWNRNNAAAYLSFQEEGKENEVQ